jgi:GT2 family glycosyltransferase
LIIVNTICGFYCDILIFMKNPVISVVFGSFNQVEVLKLVLLEFENQTLAPECFEVIVVDSTSSDGSQEFLRNYSPNYKFKFFIQENQGKAAARNKGVKEASSDLILITDADMIPHKDLLKTHFETHSRFSQPVCFEGLTYNLKKLEWPTSKANTQPYITRDYKNMKKLGWFYFLTGNISFPKKLFLAEDGFDETFLSYGWEDLELGYRLSKKDIPLYYLNTAQNYHYHVVTKEEEIERNIKKGESAKIFIKKHLELKWFLGLNPVSVFLFKIIKKEGVVYSFIKKSMFTSKINVFQRFGFWFLKEYSYLQGLLR